jgi:isopenicillin N synthase-like dioxygenase
MEAVAPARRASAEELPIIDLSAADEQAIADQIRAACLSTGFFYVTGHGVGAPLADAFAATREYFALPRAVLARHERDPVFRRGLQLVGSTRHPGRAPDLKESFDLGVDLPLDHPTVQRGVPLHGPNFWPPTADVGPAFRERVEAYMEAVSRLGHRLLGAFALSLGVERDFFQRHTDNPMVQMRLFHYPPEPPPEFQEEPGAGAAPHTDFGMITLLAPDPIGGLEVRKSDGEWIAAPYVKGALVINIGDIFQRWTNDVYVSNQHRVVNPPDQPRHSIATFYHLDHDTPIRCIPTCVQGGGSDGTVGGTKYEEIQYIDYLVSRFNAVQQLGVEQDNILEKVGLATPPAATGAKM